MSFFSDTVVGIWGGGKAKNAVSFLVYEDSFKNCLLDFKITIYEKYLVKYHENTLNHNCA